MSAESATELEIVSSPSPGDGICPTDSQFGEVSRASCSLWSSLSVQAVGSSKPILIADELLKLLQKIPGLVANPSKGFEIQDSDDAFLQYALDWVTTTDQSCEQRIKRTTHYQLLGVLEPKTVKFVEDSGPWSPWLGTQVEWEHFPFLVLAWTFILSSRWVETLSIAGEETYMKFSQDGSIENFWGLVAEQQWQASMVRGKKTFYAPWSLVDHNVPRPVLQVQVPPNSSYAFKNLERFCARKKINRECVAAALAFVLMLPQTVTGVKLPLLSAAPVSTRNSNGSWKSWRDKLSRPLRIHRKSYYNKMFECLNQCITMSCTPEGISSLLCGVFFDPAVPCNLIGAHLSGITEAIKPTQGNAEAFVRLMAKKSPSTSPFWLAAVWTGHSSVALSSALAGMASLSLPMASWTETPQSFIQFGYRPITHRAESIARAREFQNLYFITPDAPMPLIPSPPFGETSVSNTSLEIQSHLPHNHSPIQHRTHWVLNIEDGVPAQVKHPYMSQSVLSLPPIRRGSQCVSLKLNRSTQVIDTADRISSDATLNLFSWYREVEGGLWLEETQGKHPWIDYDSDESCSLLDEESLQGQ